MVPEKVNVRTAKDGTMVATVGFGGGMPVETYRTDRFGRGLWRLEGGRLGPRLRRPPLLRPHDGGLPPLPLPQCGRGDLTPLPPALGRRPPPRAIPGRLSLLTRRASDRYDPGKLRNFA